jgi:hypothetical protein
VPGSRRSGRGLRSIHRQHDCRRRLQPLEEPDPEISGEVGPHQSFHAVHCCRVDAFGSDCSDRPDGNAEVEQVRLLDDADDPAHVTDFGDEDRSEGPPDPLVRWITRLPRDDGEPVGDHRVEHLDLAVEAPQRPFAPSRGNRASGVQEPQH